MEIQEKLQQRLSTLKELTKNKLIVEQENALLEGQPQAYHALLVYYLLNWSELINQFVLNHLNYNFENKSVKDFIDTLFLMLQNNFDYNPLISKSEFINRGYAEKKLQFCIDIIKKLKQKQSQLYRQNKKSNSISETRLKDLKTESKNLQQNNKSNQTKQKIWQSKNTNRQEQNSQQEVCEYCQQRTKRRYSSEQIQEIKQQNVQFHIDMHNLIIEVVGQMNSKFQNLEKSVVQFIEQTKEQIKHMENKIMLLELGQKINEKVIRELMSLESQPEKSQKIRQKRQSVSQSFYEDEIFLQNFQQNEEQKSFDSYVQGNNEIFAKQKIALQKARNRFSEIKEKTKFNIQTLLIFLICFYVLMCLNNFSAMSK